MDKYIGRLLDGRYEILEEIGRGGMAVVYRSMDHRLNRYVAVKILKEELNRDEDFRRRFHAESQAVAMLSHPNIDVCLNTEAESVFELVFEGPEEDAPIVAIKLKDHTVSVPIVYTGPLDELFLARFGRLPYRTLRFDYQSFDEPEFQPCGTVNYTVTEDFTRITEFKHLTGQVAQNTTIMREYSLEYTDKSTQIPYYAIINPENNAHYGRYLALTETLPNFYPLGRLAEYRYYNMDVIIARALELADKLLA